MKTLIKDKDGIIKRLLESTASMVTSSGMARYYYMPFWFEDFGDGEFELHHLGSLPKELTDTIYDLKFKE